MSVEADTSGETRLRFSTTPINETTKFHTAKNLYSVNTIFMCIHKAIGTTIKEKNT